MRPDSFYPIFPVPLDLAHDVNLDVTHSDLLYMCPQDDADHASAGGTDSSKASCAPDVLIIPSRLKHFSKVRASRWSYPARLLLTRVVVRRSWTTLLRSTRLSSRSQRTRWWNTPGILRLAQHETD